MGGVGESEDACTGEELADLCQAENFTVGLEIGSSNPLCRRDGDAGEDALNTTRDVWRGASRVSFCFFRLDRDDVGIIIVFLYSWTLQLCRQRGAQGGGALWWFNVRHLFGLLRVVYRGLFAEQVLV